MTELIALRSPVDLLLHSPEMFLAETITYLTFAIGLAHARRNGPEHVLFLLVALCAASFVDPFCLISPQIRNYFHSHASVLLYDRHVAPWQFPFFGCLSYVGGAVVWSLRLRSIAAEACLVAFVSSYTFYVFDVFACRWLLYQWHNQDPLYAARTLCVPLASSMWVMTYSLTASALARLAARFFAKHEIDLHQWWNMTAAVFLSVLAFLPLHVVPISIFYFPTIVFGKYSYEVVVVFGLACLAVGLTSLSPRTNPPGDAAIHLAMAQSLVWFGGVAAALVLLDPGHVVSTCVHEPYGGRGDGSALCSETESYLFGLGTRKRYVCDNELVWWKIVSNPQPKQDMYTIQGLPMDLDTFVHQARSLAVGSGIHLVIFLVYFAFAHGKKKKKTS
jgi:hypothetical protein